MTTRSELADMDNESAEEPMDSASMRSWKTQILARDRRDAEADHKSHGTEDLEEIGQVLFL